MEPYVAATSGMAGLVLSILIFVLGICLVLAPLFIWKWTKATKAEVTRLNANIIVMITMLRRWEHRYLLLDGEQVPDTKEERIVK